MTLKIVIIHSMKLTLNVTELYSCHVFSSFNCQPYHGGMVETCFPFEQHGCLLHAWLLEGFELMACKRKEMLSSVPKLRVLSI